MTSEMKMKVTTAKIGLLALLTVIFMFPNSVSAIADASTWTSGISASDNQWSSVTYGNGLLVAVATSGAGNRLMTSGAFVVPTTTTIAPVTTTVTLIAAVKKTESLPATGREPSTLILMGAFFAMSGVVLVGRRRFN